MVASVHGVAEAGEKVGVVALAALLGLVLLGSRQRARTRTHARTRAVAILATLILTPTLLTIDVWHTSQMRDVRHHPTLAVAAALAAIALVIALARLVSRRPWLLQLLAVGALPFRLPISTGEATSNLLVPLYLVVAAGALARASRSWRPTPAGVEPQVGATPPEVGATPPEAGATPPGPPSRAPMTWAGTRAWIVSSRGLETLLVASVALYAIQACYSADFSKALENVVFFYVPFGLLFWLLRDGTWSRRTVLACAGIALAEAICFAGVGFVEYHRRQLFLNPKVVVANQYDNYFRVNSLFFDPNVYGRFLALVMLIVMVGVLWSARRREVVWGGLALAWLWGGLITSFSQSSIAALLLGLAVIAAWRWDARATVYSAGALIAIGLVVVFAAPPGLHIGLSGKGGSASNATSGRTKLIEGGISLFGERPLQGFGPGAFAKEYRAHQHVTSSNATSASHTIPVTVAAEQGIVGVALYVALLLSAFGVLFTGAGRSPPRIALAACFAALVVHTWTYADFLEDPVTWTLLGAAIGLGAGAGPRPGGKRARAPELRDAAPAASQA